MNGHDVAGLRARIDRALDLARSAPDVFSRRVPARSGWSVAQHLEHLALALLGSLAAARRILGGKGEHGGGSRPMARELLEAGTIPRGVATAPPVAVPADAPAPEAVAALLGKARGKAEAFLGREAELEAATGTLDHPALGRLGARDWIAFASVHTAHHLAIIDELLSDATPR